MGTGIGPGTHRITFLMIADTGGFGGIGILTFYEKLRLILWSKI